MQHTIEKVLGGHHCTTCGYTWKSKPTSTCPGVTLYDGTSTTLKTKTQWKTVKREPIPGLTRAGCYWSGYEYVDLWNYEQTTPIVKPLLTDEERADRKAKRLATRTCQQCKTVQKKASDLETFKRNRLCAACVNKQIDEEEADHLAMLSADRDKAAAWASRMLARPAEKWCILDTETTSLTGAIIEIAVVDGAGAILLNTRLQPREPITPGAQAIHDISDDDLRDAPLFPDIYDSLAAALRDRHLVVYNLDFDSGRLAYECERWRLPYLLHTRSTIELTPLFPRQWRKVDAPGVVKREHDAMEPYSAWVGEWSDYHGEYRWQKLYGGHSALSDCLAVRERIMMMRDFGAHHEEHTSGVSET